MAKDRAKDDRRSVGSHEKMMSALGRAAGKPNFNTVDLSKPFEHPDDVPYAVSLARLNTVKIDSSK